jgi:hypothetical protein
MTKQHNSNMKIRPLYFSAMTAFISVGLPSIAQEAFLFQNYRPDLGIDAPVFDAAGNRLTGTNYVAMLFGGPTPDVLAPATTISRFVPMPPVPFTYMPGGLGGYFAYGIVQITNVCIIPAWLQVRAWDARLGSTYEEVIALGVGGYGQSPLFQLHGSDTCLPNPPPAVHLIGLQSFSLVPEPGPVLLLLIAVPWVVLRLRRRSKC